MSLSDGEPALAGSAARLVAETGMPSAAQNLPKAFACIRKAFISSLPFVFVFLDCGRCFLTPQWLEPVIHNISAGAGTDKNSNWRARRYAPGWPGTRKASR